jgi:hypothetical protein
MEHRFGGARIPASRPPFVDANEVVNDRGINHVAAIHIMVAQANNNSLARQSLAQTETDLPHRGNLIWAARQRRPTFRVIRVFRGVNLGLLERVPPNLRSSA